MSHKEVVVDGIKIEYEGIFNFDELYQHLRKWMERKHYKFGEAGYKEIKGDTRSLEINFGGYIKVDEYVKYVIEAPIELKDLKEVTKKGAKGRFFQGKFKIIFKGHLVMDYEDKWEKNAVTIFLREVYDKYIIKSRVEKMEKELKGDIDKLVDEIKAFLKLLKF